MAYQPWFDGTFDPIEPEIWNTVILDGKVFPGHATIDGDVERDIDVKKVKGKDGATFTDNGSPPASVSVTLILRTAEQWFEFQELLPDISPRKKGALRAPVTLEHPASAVHSITQVYVRKISFPKVEPKKGIVVSISCVEYVPSPKPTAVKQPLDPVRDFTVAMVNAQVTAANALLKDTLQSTR